MEIFWNGTVRQCLIQYNVHVGENNWLKDIAESNLERTGTGLSLQTTQEIPWFLIYIICIYKSLRNLQNIPTINGSQCIIFLTISVFLH